MDDWRPWEELTTGEQSRLLDMAKETARTGKAATRFVYEGPAGFVSRMDPQRGQAVLRAAEEPAS